jgi:ElaB/YqjD/DUF883 family membrane-anchored ribosome-binding protein
MENSQSMTEGTDLRDLSSEIQEGIEGGKYTWREIQEAVMAKTKQTAVQTDEYVHENPWKVVCWAGGLGFVLGLLMAPSQNLLQTSYPRLACSTGG